MRRLIIAFALLLVSVLPARAVTVERVVSPGGIEAWLVQDHANPIIAIDLMFRGGAALDPPGKEGLANLVSGLLDEGAGEMDSLAFQTKLEDLAIHFSFNADRDSFGGTVRTLTENRDVAFELLRLALTAPRFDADPVERIRAQTLATLKREAEDADSVAAKAWFAAAYAGHPYARPVDGTLASVAALTRDDLVGFVRGRFARDTLIVGVAGDITPAELAPKLDAIFGGLPAKAQPFAVSAVRADAAGQVKVVPKAIPQSVAVFGHAGLQRSDPDWYAAYLLNYILGGGSFSSRLMEEVRERRGLAYSVYTHLLPYAQSGLVMGGVATQNPRFGESLALIRNEWKRLADSGPTEAELANAKTYLTGSWPLQLDGTAQIAGVLVAIQKDKLGIDYLDKRNGYLQQVTLDDAKRVAARLFKPEALSVVVVGQPQGVESTASTTPAAKP